jgi:uncharacterized protein (DUF736 family)
MPLAIFQRETSQRRTAALTIVRVDKVSDDAPNYRVQSGQRYELDAG